VQVTVTGARIGAHPPDRHRFHRQRRCRALQLLLLLRITATLPGHQRAPRDQQRGRQLGQGREASKDFLKSNPAVALEIDRLIRSKINEVSIPVEGIEEA
jgi:hypothetical protein